VGKAPLPPPYSFGFVVDLPVVCRLEGAVGVFIGRAADVALPTGFVRLATEGLVGTPFDEGVPQTGQAAAVVDMRCPHLLQGTSAIRSLIL